MNDEAKYNWRTFAAEPSLGAGYLQRRDALPAAIYRNSDTYNCVLVVEGELRLRYGEEEVRLAAGDIMQRWPGQSPDAISSDEATLLYCITLSTVTYQALAAHGLLQNERIFSIQLPEYLTRWMPNVATQLRSAAQDKLFESYLNVQRVLIHLHRAARRDEPQQKAALAEYACQRLCDQCLLSTPDIEGIAAELGVSYETFRKLFRTQIGMAPHHYLLQQRFIHARRLLREGSTVQQTAAAVGYADPYTFSRQFKLQTGMPPTEYRRLYQTGKK